MRYAYLTLLVVLIVGGIWAFTNRDSANDTPLNTSDSGAPITDGVIAQKTSGGAGIKAENYSVKSVSTAQRSDAQIDPRLEARLDVMHQRRPGQTYRVDQVSAVVARNVAWTPVDEAPTSLPLTPEQFTDGRQFIRFDPLKIESLIPGDTFTVALEKFGKQYRVQIDSVEEHGGGRTSWYGHLTGLGDRYSVTFTRGPSLTVGGLDTPTGHYVLQAHGENGWIATSESLFKRNPNETDAIVPPSDEQ